VSTVTITSTAGVAASAGVFGNELQYVPNYCTSTAVAYSAQMVTTSAGNVVTVADLSGHGFPVSVPGTWTAPTYSATGGGADGGLPFWAQSPSPNNMGLANTSWPSTTVSGGELALGLRPQAQGSKNGYIADFGVGNENSVISKTAVTPPQIYEQTGIHNTVTLSDAGIDIDLLSYISPDGGGSQQILNGGAPVVGATAVQVAGDGGLAIGRFGGSSSNFGFVGSFYYWVFYPTALSTTGRVNWHTYAVHIGLNSVAGGTRGASPLAGLGLLAGITLLRRRRAENDNGEAVSAKRPS
jgi:hypothetical protein